MAASRPSLPSRVSLSSKLNTGWRICATGFCFAVFGLGGSSLGLLLVLILLPLPIPTHWKHRVIRRLLSDSFKVYLFLLRICGLLSREYKGIKSLNRPGQLLIANHPSLLDVVFLISIVRNANCVIKQGIRENKFTFIPSKIAGYITNEDEDMIGKCKQSLADGDTLIIFPEGTRSTPGEPIKLMRGLANIAISSHKNITPILICCEPPHLIKGRKWYDVPLTKPHYHIEVLSDILIEPYLEAPQSKAARQLTRDIEEIYSQHLQGLHTPPSEKGILK